MPSNSETRKMRHTRTGFEFTLRFEKETDGIKVYVENCPRTSFSNASSMTHIMPDKKLCFTEVPQTMDRAIALAVTWIEYYATYCQTGQTQQIPKKINVNARRLRK